MNTEQLKYNIINTKRDFNLLVNRNFGKIIALFFFADWNAESIELKDLIMEYLQSYDLGNCIFGFVDSNNENLTFLCEDFNIESVPSCLLIDGDKNVLHNFDNMNPGEMFQTIEEQILVWSEN